MINCSGTRLEALLPMAKCLCATLGASLHFYNLFAASPVPPTRHAPFPNRLPFGTCVWHFYLFGSCFCLSLFNLVCPEIDLLQSYLPLAPFFHFIWCIYFAIFLTRPRLPESFWTPRRSRINAAVANVLLVTFT